VKPDDANVSVVIETLTEHGSAFLHGAELSCRLSRRAISASLVVDGEPVPYCLARIPAQGETRGNLAAGGRGEARPLSESDWQIARAVAPTLKAERADLCRPGRDRRPPDRNQRHQPDLCA
jgi:glutathione synthase